MFWFSPGSTVVEQTLHIPKMEFLSPTTHTRREREKVFVFQSTLNCELLSDVIGLELRWTITEETGSVILQLVSK
jgi:hypothetical protein